MKHLLVASQCSILSINLNSNDKWHCLQIFLSFSPDSLLVDKFKTAHLFSAHIGRHAERKKFRGQTPLKCFYLMKTPFGTSLANDFRKKIEDSNICS
jgi:hypothetical protein